jgi:very-short-patch-repair endonuclease
MERAFNSRNTKRARDLRKQGAPAEIKLWQRLSKRQLDGFKFSRQIPIGQYFADFVCRSARLVVEIDGPSHDVQVEYDCDRTEWIEAQGYRLIRFTNGDVMQNLEGVIVMIGQVLAEMSLPTPVPLPFTGGEQVKINSTEVILSSYSPPAGGRGRGWASRMKAQ